MHIKANGDVRFMAGVGNVVIKTVLSVDPNNPNVPEVKVGIGTENPVRSLHIYTTHAPDLPPPPTCPTCPIALTGSHNGMRLEDLSGSNNPVRTIWDIAPYSGSLFFSKGDPNNDHIIDAKMAILGNGNVGIGTTAPQALFHVATDKNTTYDSSFVVTSGGRVGIGTTAPAAKLDVNGTMNATSYLKGGQPFAGEWQTNNNDIYNANTGNVGIGTSAPQQLLEVNGGNTPFGTFGRFGNNNGRIDIGFNGANAIIDANQGGLLINWYSGKDVAIGGNPTNPPSDLTVSGNILTGTYNDPNSGKINMQSKNPKLEMEDTDDFVKCEIEPIGGFTRIRSNRELAIFLDTDDNESGETFRVVTNSAFFGGNYKTLFTVNESGDADLCGRLKAKKLRIETAGCDFVFEPDYERMTWQEKELYYKTHKRLPHGLDAAATMENDGLDVGTNFTSLLQNVEEDRLDITELFMRMEKLEKQNEMLIKQNEELKKGIEKLKKK